MSRGKRLFLVFWRRRWIVVPLALLPVAFVWAAVVPTEQTVRLWGTGLEAVGLGLIFRALAQTAREFERPPIHKAVAGFLSEVKGALLPPVAGQARVLEASGLAAGLGGAEAHMEVSPRTLEERVENLERRVEVFKRQTTERLQQLNTKLGDLNRRQDEETSALRDVQGRLDTKLTTLAVGDLYVAYVGVLLTFVGLIAGNAPVELLSLFGVH